VCSRITAIRHFGKPDMRNVRCSLFAVRRQRIYLPSEILREISFARISRRGFVASMCHRINSDQTIPEASRIVLTVERRSAQSARDRLIGRDYLFVLIWEIQATVVVCSARITRLGTVHVRPCSTSNMSEKDILRDLDDDFSDCSKLKPI